MNPNNEIIAHLSPLTQELIFRAYREGILLEDKTDEEGRIEPVSES